VIFPSGFPIKILHAFLLPPCVLYGHAHFILLTFSL
jgi:hypothetical protein